jgi:hypothetical protein
VGAGREVEHGQADAVRHAQPLGGERHVPRARDRDATGDYVWRWTYDLLYETEAMRRLPQPEIVNPKLDSLFDFDTPPAP